MTAVLRVVLDQVVAPTDPDLATASGELASALVRTAPDDCMTADNMRRMGAKCAAASAMGLTGGSPQSWPCVLSGSGGAPTFMPRAYKAWSAQVSVPPSERALRQCRVRA